MVFMECVGVSQQTESPGVCEAGGESRRVDPAQRQQLDVLRFQAAVNRIRRGAVTYKHTLNAPNQNHMY